MLKVALCSFEEEIQIHYLYIYKINEVTVQVQYCFVHNWINKLFSEDK